MKELTLNETQTVNGGAGNVCWMVAGYVFGEAVNAARNTDWGSSMYDPDTNLAP